MHNNTKKCNACQTIKPLNCFYRNAPGHGTYYNICKLCAKIKSSNKYYSNHTANKEKFKINSNNIRIQNKNKILAYLSQHQCVVCGENDPIILEFDHITNKSFNISSGTMKTWKNILNEIKKCNVICVNCHRDKSHSTSTGNAKVSPTKKRTY